MPKASSKETTRTSDTFIQSLPLAVPFSKPLGGRKFITVSKPSNDQKFPQNVCPNGLLFTTGKLFEAVMLEGSLLNANQFVFVPITAWHFSV
jgi:hypothetical protein